MEKTFNKKIINQETRLKESLNVNYYDIDLTSLSETELKNFDAIKQQFNTWINTYKGERYFNLSYGNPLKLFIHKYADSITSSEVSDFYTQIETDLQLVKINRNLSKVYYDSNGVLFFKIYLNVPGLSENLMISST